MRRHIRAIALVVLCASPFGGAAAEPVRFPFRLPHCAAPLTLVAPEVFAGAENKQENLDILNAGPAKLAIYALFTTPVGKYYPILSAMEMQPPVTSDGKVSPEQFAKLKQRLLNVDLEDYPAAKARLDENLKARGSQTQVDRPEIYQLVATDTSVTQFSLATLRRSDPTKNRTLYSASITQYVHECVVSMGLSEPADKMTVEDFRSLANSLSIE